MIEFGLPIKLVELIKMCLNETYNKIRKHLSDNFPIQNCLEEDALMPLLFNFASEHAIRKVQGDQVGYNINTIKKNTGSSTDACRRLV
jgi:hypothetical protein